MHSWRIYYDDDRSFGSDQGSWIDAPTEGVLAIVELLDGKLTIHSGHDFYQIEDESIVMRDERTLLHAIGHIEMSPIKFGRYTSASKMERVFRRIREERR